MIRRTLPQRRAAETFNLRFWNQAFTVTVGFYADGTPGEVFIDGGKTGQDIQSTARDAAVVLSLALKHGTAIETIRHAVTRNGSGSAASILGAVADALRRPPMSISPISPTDEVSNAEQNARRNLLRQSRRHERCSQQAHRARF